MAYFIDAWLEEGGPRLEILDADSGAVRLRWAYDGSLKGGETARKVCADRHLCPARIALHQLIKGLFRVSCAGKLRRLTHLHQTDRGQACVTCAFCSQDRAARIRQDGVSSDVDALIVDEVSKTPDAWERGWKNV